MPIISYYEPNTPSTYDSNRQHKKNTDNHSPVRHIGQYSIVFKRIEQNKIEKL